MDQTHVGPVEVGRRLGVSAEHVGDLIRAGLLRASNVGLGRRPQWRISLTDLDAFLAGRVNQSAAVGGGGRSAEPVARVGGDRRRVRSPVGEEFV
jgi:excisionase family DNA binding protein